MPTKKSYPLRISPDVLQAMRRWSDDEIRSLNAQIEYVLRDALRKTGRMPDPTSQEDRARGDITDDTNDKKERTDDDA